MTTEGAIKQFLLKRDLPLAEWLLLRRCKVYVRRGSHYFNGGIVFTFDIANIHVDIDWRNQGVCKRLLQVTEEVLVENPTLLMHPLFRSPIQGIYVENVFDNFFRAALLRWGFQLARRNDEGDIYLPSYYKPLPLPLPLRT